MKMRIFPENAIVILIIIVGIFMSDNELYAQKLEAGGFFTMGFPKDEFRENVDNTGLGGTAFIGYRLAESPVAIGMEAGYMIYGHETRNEPFSHTIPDVFVEVKTSNNIFMWHTFLRVEPGYSVVQPYFDALIGFKYLFTKTSINSEEGWSHGEPIASSTNLDDFAFSYGTGGGIRFRVWEAKEEAVERSILEALIDIQFRYLFGAEAEYLKKGSIIRTGSSVTYDVQKSRTDMLLVNIGFTVRF